MLKLIAHTKVDVSIQAELKLLEVSTKEDIRNKFYLDFKNERPILIPCNKLIHDRNIREIHVEFIMNDYREGISSKENDEEKTMKEIKLLKIYHLHHIMKD